MRTRLFLCIAAASSFALSGLVAYAGSTHEGKVLSIEEGTGNSDGKLVMTDKDGKDEHRHSISSDVKIMRDNKQVKLSDLKKGDFITVTTNSNGKVTEVAAGQNSSNRNADQNANRNSDQNKSNREGGRAGNELPDFLTSLNLTSDQKEKIKSVCSECEKDRENAWHQFHKSYREAIGIEASMLASIEENLTESQRKQIREQRERVAKGQDSDENSKKETSNNNRNNSQGGAAYEEITIVTLTPEQEDAADDVRGNYSNRLRRLNHKISELHSQLVAMEVGRLVKIEDILTKEQRQQLRKAHQNLGHSNVRTSQIPGSTK